MSGSHSQGAWNGESRSDSREMEWTRDEGRGRREAASGSEGDEGDNKLGKQALYCQRE